MLWVDEAGRTRRPVVAIDDHLYHTGELLDALAATAPHVLPHLTVCALDRPGPDTDAAVREWITRYPSVNVVTLRDLSADAPADHARFAREVARLLRPGGIVLQDIQLETLSFIPADRWWESIYLGATIRGLFPDRPAVVRFCSNKRGYDATFGKDLIDAGFDPRDVMDKRDVGRVVVPALVRLLATQFPRELRTQAHAPWLVHDSDRADVERECDVVLWRGHPGAFLGGRAFAGPVALKAGTPEIDTWRELVETRLEGRDGVPVLDIGTRLAEPGAERAELTNLAARHIHGLRARLHDADAIVTAHHRYSLGDRISVALV